jgi:hypothetical protein
MRRFLAAAQGLYFAATGLWPLFHLRSFLAVTGPKTDLWLLYTVSLLIMATGLVLLTAAIRNRVSTEVVLLGIANAAALCGIDVVFVALDVISRIYLLDAVIEVAIIAGWAIAAWSPAGADKRQGEE